MLSTVQAFDLATLAEALPNCAAQHVPGSERYGHLKPQLIRSVADKFASPDVIPVDLPPFGEIVFPYVQLGNIDTLDLFGLDEMILFAFYWRNRELYRRVADFGANLGLHTLILDRCGYEVRAFEPDPKHLALLQQTLERNGCQQVAVRPVALSTEDGTHEFTRVLGNTTGSHLTGAKASPYGELERFSVTVENALPHMAWADLVKMDIEGHEADVLCATDAALWQRTDAVVEVGSAANADRIHAHFESLPVNLFAQKIAWQRVETRADMPESHRDGSLFISTKDAMPWI